MARKHRSEMELNKALDSVLYSVGMLSKCAEELASTMHTEMWICNVILESYLIHARELLEFFHPSPNVHPDTILAVDFFPANHTKQWASPAESEELAKDHKELHTYLAHLSYDRNLGEKKWNVGRIHGELSVMIGQFRRGVEEQKVGLRLGKLSIFKVKGLEVAYGTSSPITSEDVSFGEDMRGSDS